MQATDGMQLLVPRRVFPCSKARGVCLVNGSVTGPAARTRALCSGRVPSVLLVRSVPPFFCRFAVPGQDHHRHPAAPGGRQAAHLEREVVARERLPGGGEQGGQRPGDTQHRGDFHRPRGRPGALRLRGHGRVSLQAAQNGRA